MQQVGCVSNHKPRKGTETSNEFNHIQAMSIVSNHKPRKGTETSPPRRVGYAPAGVSNHKPRKGTETVYQLDVRTSLNLSFKSQTPQGDGNRRAKPKIQVPPSFKSQTPQGDGNYTSSSSMS